MSNLLRFEKGGNRETDLRNASNEIIRLFAENNPNHAEAAHTIANNIEAILPDLAVQNYTEESIGELIDEMLTEILSGNTPTPGDTISPEPAAEPSKFPNNVIDLFGRR